MLPLIVRLRMRWLLPLDCRSPSGGDHGIDRDALNNEGEIHVVSDGQRAQILHLLMLFCIVPSLSNTARVFMACKFYTQDRSVDLHG